MEPRFVLGDALLLQVGLAALSYTTSYWKGSRTSRQALKELRILTSRGK